MECSFCHSNIRVSNKYGFPMCKQCAGSLPTLILKRIRSYSRFEIESLMRYEDDDLIRKWSPTAHYGSLAIDETHGLVGLFWTEKARRERPLVFRCFDLEEVGLYCTNGRATTARVFCDVEFRFSCPSLPFAYKTLIKRHISCKYHHTTSIQVEYIQPGDFTLFRDMYESMWNRFARMKFEDEMQEKMRAKYEFDQSVAEMARERTARQRALDLFMLEEGFTQDDLRANYRRMLKAFHPDLSDADDKYTRRIIEAYELLKEKS